MASDGVLRGKADPAPVPPGAMGAAATNPLSGRPVVVYPHDDSDGCTWLAPDVFYDRGGACLNWKGENYLPESEVVGDREEAKAAAMTVELLVDDDYPTDRKAVEDWKGVEGWAAYWFRYYQGQDVVVAVRVTQ